MLDIAGFAGNDKLWAPANGANSTINFSLDGCNWVFAGKIPNSFGNIVQRINFDVKQLTRFIQFKNNSYLGIGYLKVFGDKNNNSHHHVSVSESVNLNKNNLNNIQNVIEPIQNSHSHNYSVDSSDIFLIEVTHKPYKYNNEQAGSTNANDLSNTDLSKGK